MIIAGAGGHSKEILDIIFKKNYEDISFFDDMNKYSRSEINGYKIINSVKDLEFAFKTDKRFIIGVGNSLSRKNLFDIFIKEGGEPYTIIADNSFVSNSNTEIGLGSNVMQFSFISCEVKIGIGVLINARANIHHNVTIGDFSEIGPGAILLGGVFVGTSTLIGAGAVVLPGVSIGDNCRIGAGSVVTNNVNDNQTIKGNPAK